jgi:hypothetical protein
VKRPSSHAHGGEGGGHGATKRGNYIFNSLGGGYRYRSTICRALNYVVPSAIVTVCIGKFVVNKWHPNCTTISVNQLQPSRVK